MARRIYLHIGTMKAATTYLQNLFDDNAEMLARRGILWQGSQANQYAVQDFVKSSRLPPGHQGAFERLCREIHQTAGDVLVSVELLARLPPARINRLIRALGDAELRVVVTARDLARVAVSQWQETTQNRHTTPWAEWIADVCRADPADSGEAVPFWRHQYLPDIVEKWSAVAASGRVHLVTVPQPGADPGLVWQRFASVLEIPADGVVQPEFSNPGLGATSAELMRRLNTELEDLDFAHYRWGFKAALAKQGLTLRAGEEPRPSLTPDQHARLRDVAVEMVDELVATGQAVVVGDLAELVPPAEPAGPPYDPEQASDAELLAAAMDGLVALGRQFSELYMVMEELQANVAAPAVPEGSAPRGEGSAAGSDVRRTTMARLRRALRPPR